MLLVEPSFLPLQPLPPHACPRSSAAVASLPASCTINSLRRSFTPFPVRSSSLKTPREHVACDARKWEVKPAAVRTGTSLRSMRSSDVECVKRLQEACLPVSYPSTFYTLLLTNPSSLCLLACSMTSPSTLLGCISGHLLSYTHCPLSDEPEGDGMKLPIVYLTSLAVDQLARNQGLGSRLISSLIAELIRPSRTSSETSGAAALLQLHVEAKNKQAISLYRKLGLSEVRALRGYYKGVPGGGDAIEMRGIVQVHS